MPQVDYKAPMKPNTSAVVTARIASVEGKKVWVECALADKPLTGTEREKPGVGDPELVVATVVL